MTPDVLMAMMEATWPAARTSRVGPWAIREGQGGGKRVSAATADGLWSADEIPAAEAAMAALDQPNLFLIRDRDRDSVLDAALHQRGYRIVDPVVAYAAQIKGLAPTPPASMSSFPHWPPLAIAAQLWEDAGITAGRIAVMNRVVGPKVAILSRANDRPTGVAFVAVSGSVAMLHALEVAPAHRRQGSAYNILRAAAHWAQDQGVDTLALVVTEANEPARNLYASVGMTVVGHYHYRQK